MSSALPAFLSMEPCLPPRDWKDRVGTCLRWPPDLTERLVAAQPDPLLSACVGIAHSSTASRRYGLLVTLGLLLAALGASLFFASIWRTGVTLLLGGLLILGWSLYRENKRGAPFAAPCSIPALSHQTEFVERDLLASCVQERSTRILLYQLARLYQRLQKELSLTRNILELRLLQEHTVEQAAWEQWYLDACTAHRYAPDLYPLAPYQERYTAIRAAAETSHATALQELQCAVHHHAQLLITSVREAQSALIKGQGDHPEFET